MTAIKATIYPALAIVLGLIATSPAQATAAGGGGCRQTVNYAAPFTRMPPIHRPPPDGERLPFAPHGITLRVPVPRVLVGSPRIGFEVDQFREGSPRLDWTVVSSLSRLQRNGAVAKVIRSKRQRINRVDFLHPEHSQIMFAVSPYPAFYRVSSTFFDASGRRLGKYAEYFRILKYRAEYCQSVSPSMAHGGDVLRARTDNPGTTTLIFGNGYAIDRFNDGEWKLDPVTPKGFAGVGVLLFGGGIYEEKVRLPTDMAPGHYRFRKKVRAFQLKPHTIAADFFVLQ